MDMNRDTLIKLYTTMVTIRNFEERGIPETGQRGMSASVHSSAGQEAVPTGICANLTNEDYIGSTHRGHGHCIAKGVDPKLMMAELFGRATGPNKGKGGSMHIADMSKGMLGTNGVVAASVPLAVGAANVVFIGQVGADPRGNGFLSGRGVDRGGHTPLPGFGNSPLFKISDCRHGRVELDQHVPVHVHTAPLE